MSNDPLPRALDFRKAAARGARLGGCVAPADLPRLRQMLANDDGEVRAEFAFRVDDQGRCLAHVTVRARVSVECQRCLRVLEREVTAESVLAAVWSDEQARQLPAALEPLLAGESVDLWEIVEEELVLAMPPFSYHDDPRCLEALAGSLPAAETSADEGGKSNPFQVLARLKGEGRK
jgi:uncharacterized protein